MGQVRRSSSAALVTVALLALAVVPASAQSSAPSAPTAAIPLCTAIAATPPAPSSPVPTPSGSPAAASGELTVYAAASLKGAFEAFAPAYVAGTGLTPLYSFDASSSLRAQIEQAAPADVFASADVANVQELLDAGLARDAVAFACNQLTIIVPADNPAGITSAADLGRPGVKVIAAGPDVPITRYATQLVANLGIAEAYAANVVTEEDNVAAVRAKIEAGEGDAGIVYVTDAIASGDGVQQVEVPDDANVPATYAAAVVTATDQPTEAAAFLDFLTSPDGQADLAAFGFLPAPAQSDEHGAVPGLTADAGQETVLREGVAWTVRSRSALSNQAMAFGDAPGARACPRQGHRWCGRGTVSSAHGRTSGSRANAAQRARRPKAQSVPACRTSPRMPSEMTALPMSSQS
jgi:molybdate transport system substrate-binding protein